LAYIILVTVASNSIYKFASNLTITYITLQFWGLAKLTYFPHITAVLVNTTFNTEDRILI